MQKKSYIYLLLFILIIVFTCPTYSDSTGAWNSGAATKPATTEFKPGEYSWATCCEDVPADFDWTSLDETHVTKIPADKIPVNKIQDVQGKLGKFQIAKLNTDQVQSVNWDDMGAKVKDLGDKVNDLKPEQATETVYNNLDDTQKKNLNGDLWKEFMAKDKPLTGLQDGTPKEVAKGLQQQGHAVDNIDFGITPVNYDSGTLYVDPQNNPTTINLNSFDSGSHSISVGPRGVVKIDNRLSIRNANNVGASGNIITADSIKEGSTTLTQTVNGQPSSFTTTFDNVQQAYFMPDSFAFQSVDSLTITQNTTALTYIISDANNITFDGQNLLIDHADSVIIGNNIIAANADNIKIPFTFTYELFDISFELDNYQEILVERSDLVQIGDRTYTNLSNARFITNNDTIVYANVTAKTHNIYEFENPLFDEFYFV